MSQRLLEDFDVLRTTTTFSTSYHHIYLKVLVDIGQETPWRIKAILDTGAPWTELSDKFLLHTGILGKISRDVSIPPGLQTQRYGKLVIPALHVCGQTMQNTEIRVSRFDESWGVHALIGLDFFRHFPVTINYRRGVLDVG